MKSFLSSLATCALVVGAVHSQATYETFGSGCANIGTSVLSVNPNPQASNFSPSTGPNEYAYPINVAATKVTVCTGVRFFTQSRGSTETVEARIYLPDTSAPSDPSTTPLDVTKLTIGPNADYYEAFFNQPHVITGPFWVSFDNYATYTATSQGPAVVSASNLSTGTNVSGVFWRRPNFSNFTWTSTVSVDKPSYEIMTGGSPPAILSAPGVPTLGQPFQFDLTQAPTGPVIGVMGFDDSMFGSVPLPLDLLTIAPGCWLFTSLDLTLPTVSNGQAQLVIPIPNVPAYQGIRFYNQWLIPSAGANALNVILSNAGEGVIG